MNFSLRQQIAHELLGTIDSDGYCQCPGIGAHTGRNGTRDCMVKLDGAPTLYCVHTSCGAAVEGANVTLRRRIHAAESGGEERPVRDFIGKGVAGPPEAPRSPKYPPYDPTALRAVAGWCSRPVTLDWLAERSPVAVPPPAHQGQETGKLFLTSLYEPGEKVLVFTRYFSQGDFLMEAGTGKSVRLADAREVAAVPSALPAAGAEGVWFLTNPISGEWVIQPATSPGGSAKWGRRHGACVTAWRYLLLESDTAPQESWLKALCLLSLPIVSIFTSGGRSVHALVRVDAASKLELDAVRDVLRRTLGPLGADCAALSAVRLARLPGCLRLGKKDASGKYTRHEKPPLQRLVWLNPEADETPIIDLAK
jgi:hypothetical protein